MKWLIAGILAVGAFGCAPATEETDAKNMPAGTGKPLNPSGVVTDPNQKAIAEGQRAAGESANANAAKAAAGFKAGGH